MLPRSTAVHAALIGLVATSVAWGCWLAAGSSLTALEWSLYDVWLRLRKPVPITAPILVVQRDAASEKRFGTGPLDRALLARIVAALGRAGSSVIGLDASLVHPSLPAYGGAASDAILIEATKERTLVYPLDVQPMSGTSTPQDVAPHASWPRLKQDEARELVKVQLRATPLLLLTQRAQGLGHILLISDNDGVVRRVPLYVALGDHVVPAFALAVAEAFLQVRPERISLKPARAVELSAARFPDGHVSAMTLPTDRHGGMLINLLHPSSFKSVSFLDMATAIDENDIAKLREWAEGKIVLLFADAGHPVKPTPITQTYPESLIHANILNSLLTGPLLREIPSFQQVLYAMLLSGVAAWLQLVLPRWQGAFTLLLLVVGYGVLMLLGLWLGEVVMPVFLPFSALILASSAAAVTLYFTAGQRIRLLEEDTNRVQREVAALREALMRQESSAEDLEEDLEAARAAMSRAVGKEEELGRSAEALRLQLAEAHTREHHIRSKLDALERELSGLRTTATAAAGLNDVAQERLRQESAQLGILTRELGVLSVFRDAKKGARSPLAVLILGEAGTGKELFARAVHRLSLRATQPFIAVNMAAIPPELFESALFGHMRGSFTGATGDRKGYFELADKGTIFLDEIGDLRAEHQGKLLRVLQEKCFYRVGASAPTAVDVRVIAATNKDLERGIREGWFREDLYFRLKGLVLRLPPLRERRQDIPLLAEHFVREAARQAGRDQMALSREAAEALASHDWKGNVRELQQTLLQAVALTDAKLLTKEELRLAPLQQRPVTGMSSDAGSDADVLACLRQYGFDMQATARALGWDRSTVTQRLKGMGFRALVEAHGNQTEAALSLTGDPALARAVELKLREYYEHLRKTIEGFRSADEAIASCRRRFKNLPDRHFRSVEILIRQQFDRGSSQA